MSYNILNKNVNFQGPTQGTIEDVVDTHTNQAISGSKDFNILTGSNAHVVNTLSVATHAVDHAVSVDGAISASLNVSASAFYADGVLVTGGGAITAINDEAQYRVAVFGSPTTELDGYTEFTFNGSTNTLAVAGDISGSGNVSGSAFYGDGSNLDGVQTALKAGGGLNYDSNELQVKFDTLGTPAGGIEGSNDKVLIYDNSATALKQVSPQTIANLYSAAVTSYTGDTDNRVITSGGSKALVGEANLTFNDSTNKLTINGDLSGSGYVSASFGWFGTKVTAADIELGDATGLAGAGLADNGGELDVQVSGAVKVSGDRIGISGSLAGNGLSYSGGVDSIASIAVELQSNSGLSVDATGLKLNMNGLASATPSPAADSLTFIDSDGDKKCSFDTFLTAIAGANLGVSGSQLTASAGGGGAVSSVSNGADNRIATFSSSDALNGEETLTFDLYRLNVIQDQDNNDGAFIRFNNSHAGNAGQDADVCGTIEFYGNDDQGTPTNTEYARIRGEIEDASNGAEGGRLTLSVASHDATMTAGLVLVDGDAAGEVDVTIGAGDNSVTTIIGGLNVGSAANSLTTSTVNLMDSDLAFGKNSADNVGAELVFEKSRNATAGSHTVVQAEDNLGEIVFKGSDGDETHMAAKIVGSIDYGTPANNDMPGKLTFYTTQAGSTTPTEAMRIGQGQHVVIPTGSLLIQGTANGTELGGGVNDFAGIFLDYYDQAYNGRDGGRIIIRGDTSDTYRGTFTITQGKANNTDNIESLQIDSNGNVKVTGGSVGTVSDQRIKENVVGLTNMIAKVNQLNPVSFDWKDPIRNTDPERTSNTDFGFIAQEVEAIFPDVIYTGPETTDAMPDNLKHLSYSSLIPILTKAIQEQQIMIEDLEQRLAALEG